MKPIQEIKLNHNLKIVEIGLDGGMGYIYKGASVWASVVFSWGGGWDHVSVSPIDRKTTPTWDDMCRIKEMFFKDDEYAVQYHPAKEVNISNVPNCLHIWRPFKDKLPIPPEIMVGIKELGNLYKK